MAWEALFEQAPAFEPDKWQGFESITREYEREFGDGETGEKME